LPEGIIRPGLTRTITFGVIAVLIGQRLSAGEQVQFSGEVELTDGRCLRCTGSITRQARFTVKTSEFFDAQGRRLLTEVVRFANDSYRLMDMRTEEPGYGRSEEIVATSSGYVLRYRKSTGQAPVERIVRDKDLTLHGSYLAIYIAENLEHLQETEVLCRLLVVPQRLPIEVRLSGQGIVKRNGRECYLIQMEPLRAFVKPFMPTHYFYFDRAQPHQLVYYQGLIQLTDSQGDYLNAEINFKFTPRRTVAP